MSAAKFTPALLAAPGPHPTADQLRQYAEGKLSPAEQQHIEAHTLDCERCDDLVAGFAMGTPASTDQAVAELRTRLQARLEQPALRPVARPLWQPLAAAATIAGLLVGGIWGWQHTMPATPPDVARTEVPAPAATPPAPPVAATPPVAAPEAEAPGQPAAPATGTATPTPPAAAPAVASASRPARTATPAARPASPPAAADADVAVVLSPVSSPAAAEAAPDFALNDDLKDEKKEAEAAVSSPVAATGRAGNKAKSAAAPAAEGSVRRPEPMPPVPAFAAQPVGGMKTLKEYLRRAATEFEPEINTTHLSGIVHIKATVGEDGRLHNVKVTRGLRDDYDAEAERIVCDGPTWTPAVSAGRRVPSVVEITVPF